MGYLGMVGGPGPCAAATSVDSAQASACIAFLDSPYGFTQDFVSSPTPRTLTPYLIDPVTLEIEWRSDLAVTIDADAVFDLMLNDTTAIFSLQSGTTNSLFAVTHSGLVLSVSGAQVSVTTGSVPSHVLARIDDSHFVRGYRTGTTSEIQHLDTYSVSGGTISLVSAVSFTGNQTVTRDPNSYESTAPTVSISPLLDPQHYDGSGTLYCYGFGSGFFGFPRIHALPYSIGAGPTAPGLSWRSQDVQNVPGVFGPGQKIGSSEQLLFLSAGGGSYTFGFYDDGSHMHIPSTTAYPADMLLTGYPADNPVGTPFGSYFGRVYEDPAGSPVAGSPLALISQSGTTLSWSPVTLLVCSVSESDLFEAGNSTTRHTNNAGAVSVALGGGVYRLAAFRW